jgi:hypothetical protein
LKSKIYNILSLSLFLICIQQLQSFAQPTKVNYYPTNDFKKIEEAKPWVFWYWMHASFSKEGITADLVAMKEAGIAGAYIAPIKGKTNPPLFEPVIETLTPEWWQIFKYALDEADRIGIQIALLPNDGFATAGGPWIKPEMSMQKVVWTTKTIKGGKLFKDTLQRPEAYQGYYEDITVLAFPTGKNVDVNTSQIIPKVTSSKGADASFLVQRGNKKNFSSADTCWIQYEFDEPFLCRSIKISVNYYNHQSQRLIIEASDDGKNFRNVGRLVPHRDGWLDWDAPSTHAITPTKAKFFRFVYDPKGHEPGAEDLDAAKWKQSLKIAGIELSSAAKINQFEGKSGQVWRVGKSTTTAQISDDLAIPLSDIIDITDKLDANGRLTWKAPAGNWTIIRMGHTSTGHKNETAGAGKGLEVDKFNPEAIKFQFNQWYGKAMEVAGPELTSRILKVFHVDSWECGSQNWSPVFRQEFIKRNGYDPVKYLPAMAGFPIGSAETSERFLHDIRETIGALMNDNFFGTLIELAHNNGAIFTSETTAPVMVGDGLRHFGVVDVPMGEFWHNSPSHDKPNDMLDAISGAHIYGKNIIQAEGFTTVRMSWDEHPGNLKTLLDRNYALGLNKLVYHIYVHNPWMDRKPGMTLDGVGLYFQRDQTWWKPGRAWVDYSTRSQVLLQQGNPVVDIAVFIGEEMPRRSLTPDRLVNTLPGIYGKERVLQEQKRVANLDLPLQRVVGVTTSANMAQPEYWVNPLRGYAYDSFNPDVLHKATVKDGRVYFTEGMSYALLVLPQKHQMNPEVEMSVKTASSLLELVKAGAQIVLNERPEKVRGLVDKNEELEKLVALLWDGNFSTLTENGEKLEWKSIGKGKVFKGPYKLETFNQIGIEKDFIAKNKAGEEQAQIAWNHRQTKTGDIYFISNQEAKQRELVISLRSVKQNPVVYDAVTGISRKLPVYEIKNNRIEIPLVLDANESVFVLLGENTLPQITGNTTKNWVETKEVQNINTPWTLKFDEDFGGPKETVVFKDLRDWTIHQDSAIKYYSGTAVYKNQFNWKKVNKTESVWLELGEVANIAEVIVNGINCGVAWTAPYRVDVSKAIRKGKNDIVIEVSNTWANRLIGDQNLPKEKRVTNTTAPFRLEGKPLEKAGLIGPVTLSVGK